MPAVSPPATVSNCSNPTSRTTVAAANSMSWLRMRGYEMSLRPSM
jgi:hypothetical protein